MGEQFSAQFANRPLVNGSEAVADDTSSSGGAFHGGISIEAVARLVSGLSLFEAPVLFLATVGIVTFANGVFDNLLDVLDGTS